MRGRAHHYLMKRPIPSAVVLLCALCAPHAMASGPVAMTIAGCVVDGDFVSDRGHVINVRSARSQAPFALARYEGRRIEAAGDLLPSDRFYIHAPPRDLGPCLDPPKRLFPK